VQDHGSDSWSGERDGLVGRDPTLSMLRELLDEGGRTAVVTGIPGAGKTSVLTAVARAAAGGWRVVSVTCHASEQELPFGALLDLLVSVPGADAAIERLVGRAGMDPPADPLRLRLEVLDWLQSLGEDRPVLVLLDDVQWCDPSSLSVLGFVAHRIAGSRISLLAATRGDVPPAPLLDHSVVPLPPLGDLESKALLRQAGLELDGVTLPPVIERAAGNPLALLELGRAAVAGSGRTLVPSSVEASFGEQVVALPTATRRVLLLAAACDGDLRAMGRIVEPTQLVDDLAPAEATGLVQLADMVIRFRHPLARSAAYSAATTVERTQAHTLLAAAYDDDLERQVWHRAEATVVPDETVAGALAAASERAERRSAIVEAARLMARAADLTPARTGREERLLQAAILNTAAGNLEWVAEIGARLRDETDSPEMRVRASHLAAYALAQTGDPNEAQVALVDVLEQLLAVDPFWGWSSLTTLAVLVYRGGGDVGVVADWLDRYERAPLPTETPFPALVPACRAWVHAQVDPVSPPADVLALIHAAPLSDTYPPGMAGSYEMLLGATAWMLDEPEVAFDRLRRAIDLMGRIDVPDEMTQTLLALSLVEFAVGRYDAADDAGRMVLDLAEVRNQSYALNDGREIRARVAGIRGDVATARDLCDRVLLDLRVGESVALEAAIRVTMSWVRLAELDAPGAWDELRWLFREDGEPRHHHVSYRELGHVVATAVRAGAASEVEAVVAVATERLSGGGPRHRLELARAQALLAGEDAEPLHRAAVTDPEAARWPFELANARLEFGGWLRRRHRLAEARAQLQPALDVFERLGTPAWAELARAELRAAGVTTTAPEASAWAELTGQERQVVRLAASGRTNPEIAAALYLSPRTISTHLYNAFPKLGVTSRAQLRDVVMDQ
jgi:DNA-binding CsgD family transcriptional regulator